MTARPIVHFEIHGKDPAKLHEFYRTLFGWKLDHNPAMNYAMVEPGIGGPEEGVGGGITTSPGLYVLGLQFLRRRNSNFIDGVGIDAEELSRHMDNRMRGVAA